MPKRSQYSSCDACRKSKRRCEPQSESGSSSQERSTCSNCLRLRLNCTYHFATCKIQVIENRKQQKESQKRRLSNANSSSSAIWGLESLLDASSPLELEDKALFSLFPEISEPSHNPFSFSPFERLGDGLTMEDQNRVLLEDNIPRDPTTTVDEYEDLSDLSPSNIQPEIEAAHVSLSPTKFSDGSWSFQSLASPLTTLNQSYMSRILHETLHRIYNNIMFLSVSSFLGSECNPFTDTKYSLEENENQGSIFCKISDSGKHLLSLPSWSGKTSLSTPSSLIQTMLGAVSFLDHFGTLYGNGLSKDDHQRAETALGHAFHAFSSQWITGGIDLQLNRFSKSPPPIQAECSHQDIRAYYWHKARSSLAETKRVKCFKIVYAMLLFDMTTPFGKLSLLPDEQQNDFLQECIALLCPLRVKVLKYCENLGSTSTYAGTLRVGLGIISWLAFLRDTMTSATSLKPPIFDSVSLESNGELSHKLSTSAHNLLDTDDAAIFVNCSSAISQMVFLWRRLHPKLDHKLGNYSAEKSLTFITTGESHEDRIRNFINVASALDDYEMKYKDLMRYTLVNHQDFSPRTKFFSSIWIIFWGYWVLCHADALEKMALSTSTTFTSKIQQFRWTSAQSIAAIISTDILSARSSREPSRSEKVLSSVSLDDLWSDHQSTPIISAHATCGIVVNAIQKAIESLIYLWIETDPKRLHAPFMGLGIDIDPRAVWSRTLSSLLSSLISLQKVPSTSQIATAKAGELFQQYGDLISEHWVMEY